MRSLLAAAAELAGVEPDGATALVPLSGALLTAEGTDIVSTGLARGTIRPARAIVTATTAVQLRGLGLGLRTLALVTETPGSGGQQTLALHTVLDGWNLVRSCGRELDLTGAELRGAALSHADLRGARLVGADLRGADLERADLRGADLEQADLGGAVLRRANLIDARLGEADLRRCDLSHSDFRGASLDRAALRGAELWSAFVGHASWADAYLEGVDMDRADRRGSGAVDEQRARTAGAG